MVLMGESDWDDYAEDWDGNSEVQLYAEQAFGSLEQRVLPLISHLSDSKVLDFGCGTGLLSERLAPLCKQVVAVDTSEKMLDVLRCKMKSPGIDNVIAENLEMNAASIKANCDVLRDFDLILASSVCGFLPDFESTLADLASIMKPGACFVQWDWMTEMPAKRIERAFSTAGLLSHYIDEAFTTDAESQSALVIMGVGIRDEGDLF